jgi:hypothetical protein
LVDSFFPGEARVSVVCNDLLETYFKETFSEGMFRRGIGFLVFGEVLVEGVAFIVYIVLCEKGE